MSEANNLDWKTYESITRYIYETLGKQIGVKVIDHGNTCRVTGKSGVTHQIDVLTEHSDGIHSYKTAIECKYWNKKVNKDIVMKLSDTIEDTNINKGVIVSKSGFTKDALEYAKYRNIGLVELREIGTKDLPNTPKEMDIANFEINAKVFVSRAVILKIDIGNNQEIPITNEFDFYKFLIIGQNEKKVPLIDYINKFRKEVSRQNKMNEKITKRFANAQGVLFNRQTKETTKIDGITITAQLTKIDASKKQQFTLVDKVLLIMKSIFDERTFTLSENGFIVEHKD
ncbi:restriction endonuclease [uncultured Aquimarina sp.]|uniref:restriction endonuclease n=1 Tax=uncultured Aquimarina sp. TaxID=575652 RepID=UPI00260F0054|nr:restriction endonuclease [uncultured Aquimarina sp.]